MSINYWGINSKINSLKRYSNDLKSAKVKINDIKNQINTTWKADESRYLINSLDNMISELSLIASNIDFLSSLIKSANDEIKGAALGFNPRDYLLVGFFNKFGFKFMKDKVSGTINLKIM